MCSLICQPQAARRAIQNRKGQWCRAAMSELWDAALAAGYAVEPIV